MLPELTASEAITGFTSSDVSVAGGELLSFTAVSATRYDVEIMVDNSTTAPSITIAAGAFDDAAGNDNAVFSSAATRASVQNTTLWLPDNAFTAGTFDASGYSNFAELRYVGSDISGALSITGIADDMMISLQSGATSTGNLALTSTTADSDVSVVLNNTGGVALSTLDTDNITGTVTLTSIGGAANSIGTLTSSASIEISGGADTDTAQQLTVSGVGTGVSSIDAAGFGAVLNVSGVSVTDTTIIGGTAADNLEGGAGDDTIRGGDGTDTIIGGDGTDQLSGDGGQDTFVFGAGSTGTRIQDEYDTINDLTIGGGADADLIEVAGHTAMSGSLYSFTTAPADLFQAISEIRYAVLASDQDDQATVFSIDNAFYFYAPSLTIISVMTFWSCWMLRVMRTSFP